MTPKPVRWAGFLVLAEGAVALLVAAVYIVHALFGTNQDVVRGLLSGFSYGTAAWFAIIGAAVLAGGWALVTGRRWGRGIGVLTNLLLLGVAWYIRSEQSTYAGAVALVALVTLGLLLSPPALRWAAGEE